jgi:hypothetical protein
MKNIAFILLLLSIVVVLSQAQYQQPAYNPEYYNSNNNGDMIHMSEIKALTLYDNQHTTSRRGQPVPQLKCIGGDAMLNSYRPSVVQCKSMGYDGVSQQWKCEATMDDKYRFGKVLVNCEGYTGPGDANVLKGSCALDYELWYTEKGKRMNNEQHTTNRGRYQSQQQQQQQQHYRRSAPVYQESDDSSGGGMFIVVVIVLVVLVIIVSGICKGSSSNVPNAAPYTPPYNPNVYPDPTPRYTSTGTTSGVSNTTAFIGGLATGAATGYMTGRATSNRSRSYEDGYSSRSNFYPSPSNESEKSGEHKSTGYGGSASR